MSLFAVLDQLFVIREFRYKQMWEDQKRQSMASFRKHIFLFMF